ncbi:hypothetical protein EV644_10124 [Kribbella orskensis]|uniref:Uncharacterized protein n=1 Tax=Kribbella orskensis TaxID=2512216 RepID=A0ABY2BTP4_9ACTN|nr:MULTISPECIES: hypothetical protein [Kribbella]TCN44838.1 hypothetical protein EV642_101965 [Kribbella sp. VKM Ac-2500]TCO31384.1 hypothetical protein EV644_10124 [Kribbella orskensis]
MSTETQLAHRVRRRLVHAALTVIGVIGGLFCYFVCQGMFSGYPKYDSEQLSIAGMILIALTGGIAWIVDEHRMHDDE